MYDYLLMCYFSFSNVDSLRASQRHHETSFIRQTNIFISFIRGLRENESEVIRLNNSTGS